MMMEDEKQTQQESATPHPTSVLQIHQVLLHLAHALAVMQVSYLVQMHSDYYIISIIYYYYLFNNISLIIIFN